MSHIEVLNCLVITGSAWLLYVFLLRYLLIENFIPPEEKNKIMNRLSFDSEEDQWKFRSFIPSEWSVV